MKMNTLTLGFSLITSTIPLITCTTEPIRKNDTSNVGHQFYDAFVQTPGEAVVNAAHATRDLASEIAHSPATEELREAGKQLVVEAPVKAGYAIKNSVVKAANATANGAKAVYHTAIEKPAIAVKDATHQALNSDFVQGTKEAAIELGEQFKEAGEQIYDVTTSAAHTAYRILVKKPVGAIKAAAHYLAHPEDDVGAVACHACPHHHDHAHSDNEMSVTILPVATLDECKARRGSHVDALLVLPSHTEINSKPLTHIVAQAQTENESAHEFIMEFVLDSPRNLNAPAPLSKKTIAKISHAYEAVKEELCCP